MENTNEQEKELTVLKDIDDIARQLEDIDEDLRVLSAQLVEISTEHRFYCNDDNGVLNNIYNRSRIVRESAKLLDMSVRSLKNYSSK